MKKTIVVNLCGGPGAGKSTGAAYIFSKLKMAGINAELITEFAKDKTWEKNAAALSNQIYMFGKQFYRMDRCKDQVDVIITDSPLFLSILYNRQKPIGERLPHSFELLVDDIYKGQFINFTYLVKRVKKYNPAGRSQTAEQSDALYEQLKKILAEFNIDYFETQGDLDHYDTIYMDILSICADHKLLN